MIAQLYRKRWKLETLFQVLTENLCCEINTLGYPKAALFTFCVALVAYNVLSTVKAALRSVHGTEKIEAEISSYYLADEIRGTYRGMMIAIPSEEWRVFHNMTFIELSQILKHLAGLAKLRAFRRHPRGPKIAQPKRTYLKNKPHVSTAKILAQKTQNITALPAAMRYILKAESYDRRRARGKLYCIIAGSAVTHLERASPSYELFSFSQG
ncbi:hypothetical protein [Nostoc sp. 'Peltigera membranacea cyanobiont' N6]|uniref:hypothetical protein n=1 Tax=Nostoc sp. 'Peltigera membranacea cyanobiont' N6 TaxID=1261031 RepID=UPI0015E44B6B|nr:hypothetical protein [Nostoc sp. 'Peltigera membranacea cyanobiont' N6]